MISPLDAVRRGVYMPYARIPYGDMLDLPGRGATYVTDTPGPEPDSPAILLLHAVGTTGLLSWYPAIKPLSRRFRVVTMDQRWHGRGIQSEEFSLSDCADDAAAVIEVLRLRGLSRSRTLTHAARRAATAVDLAPSDIHGWALAELRRTSPWAVGQAVAVLGRHHTRPWLARIDVPTAVVVTQHDRVIPAARQHALARRIPGATVHDIPAGHASCVLQAEIFVPAFVEAAVTVAARKGELRR
jgi:3-oxoadipate enol-lactonase